MSKFSVTVVRLDAVYPHPNADRLDVARIGGYQAVTGKGTYQPGDMCVYIPEDSVVPANVAEALGIATYLVGKNKDRVKAIRLRGILSQGVTVPVRVVENYTSEQLYLGQDVAEILGITKYEEPIPIEMAGQARPWPKFLPRYDVENIKKPEFFRLLEEGEPVIISEKLHGTNCAVAVGPGLEENESAFVCSRSNALVERDTNVYWRAVQKYGIIPRLHRLKEWLAVEHISVHGEVVGVQDLKYGFTGGDVGFFAFDIRADGEWVDHRIFAMLCTAANIPRVPVLYEGPFSYTMLDELAEATSHFGGLREGVVVRPRNERSIDGERVFFKYVAGSYLTRKGGTENH